MPFAANVTDHVQRSGKDHRFRIGTQLDTAYRSFRVGETYDRNGALRLYSDFFGHFFCLDGFFAVRCQRENSAGIGEKQIQGEVNVFVREHAEIQVDLFVRQVLRDIISKTLNSVRIMGAVYQDDRFF